MSLTEGMKGRAESLVTPENTAVAMGSGTVNVFATPCMAALMEKAAVNALAPGLEPGQTSVGTHLDITHDDATPVGMAVWAVAEVTAVEGRKVSLTVAAFDTAGQIGGGSHERFLVDSERFLSKAQRRKEV